MSRHNTGQKPRQRRPPATSLANLRRGGGRPKGSPNKFTGALKDMILQALSNVGGAAYLEQQARKNPGHFLSLVGRVLPLQVKDGGAEPQVPRPVTHQHVTVAAEQSQNH